MRADAAGVANELPAELADLARIQSGVVSRVQAIEYGLTSPEVQRLLRTGRWLTMRRGVYSTHTGEQPREAELWAAVLCAGRDAVVSHHTAAELHQLYDKPSSLIHVTVPERLHIARMTGVVVHRSDTVKRALLNLSPPRTRIEDTVLDLVQQAATFDAAFTITCAASQRRLTTADRLLDAMEIRGKLRWRAELGLALDDIGTGAHSLLEYRYVRRVERPHQLPRATRQAKLLTGNQTYYLDNLYDGFSLVVELDGRQAHPDDRRWLDVRRDNIMAAQGLMTLRYGWADVTSRPCEVAIEVGAALTSRGWEGPVQPCGPDCSI